MSTVVFVGPTLSVGEVQSVLDATCLPPVAQGDIYRISRQRPRVIGIIDGYFQGVPSVWHKEILWAMAEGIHVFGSASMGALRAAELSAFGMKGVGRIFEDYRDGKLEDDDEVAVLHAPEEFAFQPLSEPMVNVRATLDTAVEEGIISNTTAQALCRIGKSLFYGERSWELLLDGAQREGLPETEIRALERWLPAGRCDLKRADALAMLAAMQELLETDETPMRVDYDFEWTDMWDMMTAFWSAVPSPFGDWAGLEKTGVLDELRLEEGRFRDARRRAVLQFLALREADRQGLRIETRARNARVTDHRKKCGLFQRADFDAWLSRNSMDDSELENFVMDELRVEAVSRSAAATVCEHLVAQLKLAGDYARLVERARQKHDILLRAGCADSAPEDTGLLPIDLVAWHFKEQLGLPMPEDMDAYLRELGLSSRALFYRILAREYLYSILSQRDD